MRPQRHVRDADRVHLLAIVARGNLFESRLVRSGARGGAKVEIEMGGPRNRKRSSAQGHPNGMFTCQMTLWSGAGGAPFAPLPKVLFDNCPALNFLCFAWPFNAFFPALTSIQEISAPS